MKRLLKGTLLALCAGGLLTGLLACGPKTPDEPDNTVTPTPTDTPTPTAEPEIYTEKLETIVIEGTKGRLSITFCKRDMVHFRFAPTGEEFGDEEDAITRQSIAKTDGDFDTVFGEVTEEGENTVLRTMKLTVTVNRQTLTFSVADAAGKTVFAGAGEMFSAVGESRRASFKRDVAGMEHFYGLGNDQGNTFTTIDHRNTVYELWLSDDNVHALIPLWYSSNGYGIYINNSNKGRVSFKSDDYSLTLDGGDMDFYFIYGPEYKTILTNWSELAGRMAMPPLYSLGLTYRGYGSWTDEQLLTALENQLDAGIKIDIAGVEPGWQSATYPCSYAWKDSFSDDPEAFINRAHALGLKVNLWEHPYVSEKSEIAAEMAQYALSGKTIGTREWEGNSGTYGFGGLVPDMTIPEAQELYQEIHVKNLLSIGVDGFKVDETDSWGASNSTTLLFPSGISNNAYHNLLGTLTVNLLHDTYREEYNKRSFMFSRGNFAGMQRYATSAYTDFYGFDQFVMSVLVQSYSGTYYTPEIRDVSTPNDVDYMRRTQLMFLTPFAMSNEWASEATVLGRSQMVIDCYKTYNELHYQLIPYMYSLFWEQHNTGIGVTRALPIEFPNDSKAMSVSNEFMLGSALLVCPVNSKARVATVDLYLPAGCTWIDYYNGYEYAGGQTISYTCSASLLPLFVRKGSILTLGQYGNNTAQVTDTTLTIAVYPSEQKTVFTHYEDDGISYDYENGVYATEEITAQVVNGKLTASIGARQGSYAVATRSIEWQLHYRTAPTEVLLDGKTLEAARSLDDLRKSTSGYYYANGEKDSEKVLYVRLPDDGKAHTVTASVGAEGAQEKPAVELEGSLFEFEDKNNTRVGASVSSGKAFASGKAVLGNVGNNGKNSVTVSGVKVDKAGTYEVEVVYMNGDNKARQLCIWTNDGEPLVLWCPSTGSFSTPASMTIQLTLRAGENTLRFSTLADGGYAPDLDCFMLYGDTPIEKQTVGTVYLPADGQLFGNAETQTDGNTGFADGVYITGFNGEDPSGVRYTVHVDAAGPYQLNISYANRSSVPETLILTVNGSDSEVAFPTTYSDQLVAVLNQTVYLVAGNNEISIHNKGGALKYECEVGGEYHSCNTKLNDGAHEHSGGYCVGAGANNGGCSFTMKGITVPEEGDYTVRIYCGSGDRRTFRLKVNGEDTETLYSAQTGHFHIFKATTVTLHLNKGENTITFWQAPTGSGDTSWMPNFDYIEIVGASAEIPVHVGIITVQ